MLYLNNQCCAMPWEAAQKYVPPSLTIKRLVTKPAPQRTMMAKTPEVTVLPPIIAGGVRVPTSAGWIYWEKARDERRRQTRRNWKEQRRFRYGSLKLR